MENAASIPKSLFSVGRGCRVFHVSGINGLNLALLGLSRIIPLKYKALHVNCMSNYFSLEIQRSRRWKKTWIRGFGLIPQPWKRLHSTSKTWKKRQEFGNRFGVITQMLNGDGRYDMICNPWSNWGVQLHWRDSRRQLHRDKKRTEQCRWVRSLDFVRLISC